MVDYIPGLIVLVLVEYLAVFLIIQFYQHGFLACRSTPCCDCECEVPEATPPGGDTVTFAIVLEAFDDLKAIQTADVFSYNKKYSTFCHRQPTLSFENACRCSIQAPHLPLIDVLLLITRFISFGWMFSVGVVYCFADNVASGNRNSWYFFTFWNVELLSAYFLLATICSVIGLVHTRAHAFSKPYVILGRYAPTIKALSRSLSSP